MVKLASCTPADGVGGVDEAVDEVPDEFPFVGKDGALLDSDGDAAPSGLYSGGGNPAPGRGRFVTSTPTNNAVSSDIME